MNRKTRAALVVAALITAQLACNFPGQTGGPTQIPGPNQTLTALFAVSPVSSATPTLPPIVTATSPASQTNPTATVASGGTTGNTNTNPTATNTPVPQVNNTATPTRTTAPNTAPTTAQIPNARPRAAVVAKYLNTPPTIDGDWAEWKDITTEYPMNNVVWGGKNWSGEDDLSGSFHIGWDNKYLYVATKIRDDEYVQNETGENIYLGDGLEILLDTNLQGDFYYNELSPDDYQIGIAPGSPDPGGDKEAYRWFPGTIAGNLSDVQIASRQEAGVYRVEVAIPWTAFKMTPTNGGHYGFAISANDNDNTGDDVQESMISNVAGRVLANPTTWGDIQFVK